MRYGLAKSGIKQPPAQKADGGSLKDRITDGLSYGKHMLRLQEQEADKRGGRVPRHDLTDEPEGAPAPAPYDADDRARGGGTHKFRTPSGSVSANARRSAESHGEAMPGGRFPIRNASDLQNAKHAFGRANDKPAVKRWINKRAKELGKPPMGG